MGLTVRQRGWTGDSSCIWGLQVIFSKSEGTTNSIRREVIFSWALKDPGQLSGLKVGTQTLDCLHLAYCVAQGKLSSSLASFLFFNKGDPHLHHSGGRDREVQVTATKTGNQKLYFVLRVEQHSSLLPLLPREEVIPAPQWGRVTFSLPSYHFSHFTSPGEAALSPA